jgi:organic hydroperoxide reductase OsmC/OhrA
MSEHKATVRWSLTDGDFLKGRYSRVHAWILDGGAAIAASPSPSVVPVPYSDPALIDPEEAFVASIASCHMLTFLFLASKQGFVIHSYQDDAVGTMTKNEQGVPWVSSVVLHPHIHYDGTAPTAEQEAKLHDAAHHGCFIANSVKTTITVVPPA